MPPVTRTAATLCGNRLVSPKLGEKGGNRAIGIVLCHSAVPPGHAVHVQQASDTKTKTSLWPNERIVLGRLAAAAQQLLPLWRVPR